MKILVWSLFFVAVVAGSVCAAETGSGLKIATFDVDATPPVGSIMAYDKVLRQDDLPLRCRGVVLLGAGEPIVLCALDWIGLANEGHDAFRDALAKAADSVSPMARARDQKLTVSFPPRPLVIDADPVRLEQILGNLLSNAIKYTPAGGEVELSANERDGQLEVRVRDTGIGIPAEALQSLFQPFVQVPGAKDYSTGGLGIGLALVRGFVELHGGSVRAESAGPGKGSTFIVLLPGASEGVTQTEVRPLAARANHGRVLVVDDNVDAATTLAEAVGLDGHEVRVFERRASVAEETSFANAGVVAPGYVTPWAAPGMPAKVARFLLSRHGLYTWGATLSEAARHVEILEFLLESVARERE